MSDSSASSYASELLGEARYCLRCGVRLESRTMFERERPCCPRCGFVFFLDPKVAVGVLAERDDRLLLTLRNHEPRIGSWSFPSGYLEAFEDPLDGVVREAFEETGIEVAIECLIGVYREPDSRVLYLAYAGRAGPGEPRPSHESTDVRFFSADALPELGFVHDRRILADWRRLVGR